MPTEFIQKCQLYASPYTNITSLDLYQFDGSPINTMLLAFSPPQMLPTITMKPTAKASATGKASKVKRGVKEMAIPLNKDARHIKREIEQPVLPGIDLNMPWWSGLSAALFGGAVYLL
jgi:hypothetical protein